MQLNGQDVGPPNFVGNINSGFCSGYQNYVFDSLALTSYNPNGVNTISLLSPDAHIGGLIADLTFTQPQAPIDLTLFGQILDGSPMEAKHLATTTTASAQVPLGLELSLALQNAGTPVKASYTLIGTTPANLPTDALYKTGVALEYDRNSLSESKTFRGVHLGIQQLNIIPADIRLPPVTVTLGVFDPGALGDDNAYDDMITTWANRRGIPPHILKGLIRQEGPFNPSEYRYEPISNSTGDRYIQTVIDNSRLNYEDYRLATSTGLAKGSNLSDLNSGTSYTVVDDVQPRHVFKLPRGPRNSSINIRPLDVCPLACVSAREIVEANDQTWNWSDPRFVGPNVDWLDQAHLSQLEFTAQTPLAASYGLMQTMYVKAIKLNWTSLNGLRNPSLLFDTPANIAAGGGSLAVGTLEFYKAYRRCRSGDWATDPNFANSADYHDLIVAALNWYNHGNMSRNVTYGDDAWSYSQQFSPSHVQSKVFP